MHTNTSAEHTHAQTHTSATPPHPGGTGVEPVTHQNTHETPLTRLLHASYTPLTRLLLHEAVTHRTTLETSSTRRKTIRHAKITR
jgi:hypothetical protein